MSEKNHIKLKFCLIGAEWVGKTSFCKRLDLKPFTDEYIPTFGVEFLVYHSTFENQDIKYQLWDSSGKDSNDSLVKQYCKTSNGILAFYDITSQNSFERLKSKIDSIKSSLNENAVIIIIGNKSDLEKQREVTQEEAEFYAKENNYLFAEISTKESYNSLIEALNKITKEAISKKTYLSNSGCLTNRSFSISLPKLVNESTTVINTARSHRIDVMSNSVLISSTHKLNDVENRKLIADLVDQIKMLKSEVDKKDNLINKLSNMREPKSSRNDDSEFERFLNIERNSFNTVKRELELKYDKISNQFAEEKARVLVKEEKIIQLKNTIESLKSEIVSLNKTNEDKSIKIAQLESDLESYENVGTKSNITITALQSDNKELQSKVLELESTIRQITCEKTEIESLLAISYERLRSISEVIEITNIENFEVFILKLKELKSDSLISREKFSEVTEKVIFMKTENTNLKESILCLKDQIRDFESQILKYKIQIEEYKTQTEAAISSREILEKEMITLKDRMINTQQVWLTASENLDLKEKLCNEYELKIKSLEISLTNHTSDYESFLEEIAQLLSDDYFKVRIDKSEVREKVKLLTVSTKHKGILIASLEEKIQSLNDQLKFECDKKSEIYSSLKSAQSVIRNQEEKIFGLEGKLSEQTTINQRLSIEREKIVKFLESLANSYELPIDIFTNSIPTLDKCIEIVLYKIENKKRPIREIVVDKFSLQAKIDSLNEQLTNKDIHLELLRKKLAELEEEKFGRSELKVEFDNLFRTNKKLNIKIEKLNEEISTLKSENAQIKAHLLDINNLRAEISNKDSELARLKLRIIELESLCDTHMIRIGGLKEEMDLTKNHLEFTVDSSDNSIKALSTELRTLKMEFEKTKSRENQLLDFRNIVAKKVGLEMNSLRVPDYEIIARIEFFVNDRIHLITHHPAVINNLTTI